MPIETSGETEPEPEAVMSRKDTKMRYTTKRLSCPSSAESRKKFVVSLHNFYF